MTAKPKKHFHAQLLCREDSLEEMQQAVRPEAPCKLAGQQQSSPAVTALHEQRHTLTALCERGSHSNTTRFCAPPALKAQLHPADCWQRSQTQ